MSIGSSVATLWRLTIKDRVPVGLQACNPSGTVEGGKLSNGQVVAVDAVSR